MKKLVTVLFGVALACTSHASDYFNEKISISFSVEEPFAASPMWLAKTDNAMLGLSKANESYCGIKLEDQTIIPCEGAFDTIQGFVTDANPYGAKFYFRKIKVTPENLKTLLTHLGIAKSVIEALDLPNESILISQLREASTSNPHSEGFDNSRTTDWEASALRGYDPSLLKILSKDKGKTYTLSVTLVKPST